MSVPRKSAKQRRTPRGGTSSRTNKPWIRALTRITVWALVLGICLVLIGGLLWGLNRALFTANPHFTLQRIEVQGNRSLSADAIRERLRGMGAICRQSNILTLPMQALRRDLESDALIAEARLVRRLPSTLRVTITERVPIATIQCATPCFVDADGVILPWRDLSAERVLPSITGVRSARKLKPGSQVEDEALQGAVHLLRLLASRPDGVLYDVAVLQLDYYLPSLRLYLRPRGAFREGAVAVVPVHGMEEALNRLRDIHRLRADEGRSIGFVDVTYQHNIPVRP